MPRLHVFEFEDQPWFPATIRGYMTDYLDFTASLNSIPFEALATRMAQVLKRTGDRTLVDLCSGAGGPLPQLTKLLREKQGMEVKGVLTDLYPNPRAHERVGTEHPDIEFWPDPVDATSVPSRLQGVRTMFNSFHHFRPEVGRKILEDAARSRQGILVYELVGRSFFGFFSVFMLLLAMPLLTPFMKPRLWTRFLFTYVIPIVPLFLFWDGMVSCLRVYSPQELNRLTESINVPGYTWEVGRMPFAKGPGAATYVIGMPIP